MANEARLRIKSEWDAAALRRAEAQLKGFSRAVYYVRHPFRALRAAALTAFSGIGRAAAGLGRKIASAFRLPDFLKFGAFWKLAAGATAAVKASEDFDRAMSLVAGVTDDTRILEYTRAVRALAMELGKSPTELAGALRQLLTRGIDPDRAVDALKTISRAAIATGGEVSGVADTVLSVAQAFGDSGANIQRYADGLFGMLRTGGVDLESLAPRMQRLAPLAAQAGIGFGELAGAIAAARTKGYAWRSLIGELARLLTDVQAPTGQLAVDFVRLGTTGRTVFSRGLVSGIEALQRAAQGGARGVRALLSELPVVEMIAGKNAAATRKMIDAMEEGGNLDRAYERVRATMEWERAWENARAAIIRVGKTIAIALAPSVEAVARELGMLGEDDAIWAKLNAKAQRFSAKLREVATEAATMARVVASAVVGSSRTESRTVVAAAVDTLRLGALSALKTGAETAVDVMRAAMPLLGTLLGKAAKAAFSVLSKSDFEKAVDEEVNKRSREYDASLPNIVPKGRTRAEERQFRRDSSERMRVMSEFRKAARADAEAAVLQRQMESVGSRTPAPRDRDAVAAMTNAGLVAYRDAQEAMRNYGEAFAAQREMSRRLMRDWELASGRVQMGPPAPKRAGASPAAPAPVAVDVSVPDRMSVEGRVEPRAPVAVGVTAPDRVSVEGRGQPTDRVRVPTAQQIVRAEDRRQYRAAAKEIQSLRAQYALAATDEARSILAGLLTSAMGKMESIRAKYQPPAPEPEEDKVADPDPRTFAPRRFRRRSWLARGLASAAKQRAATASLAVQLQDVEAELSALGKTQKPTVRQRERQNLLAARRVELAAQLRASTDTGAGMLRLEDRGPAPRLRRNMRTKLFPGAEYQSIALDDLWDVKVGDVAPGAEMGSSANPMFVRIDSRDVP